MAELENLLLEAAGKVTAAKRKRDMVSHADDGNDSRDKDSDNNHGYVSKRPACQVSLKKRYEATEGEDYQGSDADDNFGVDDSDESDVGGDLYWDEDDKMRLSEMTELEREMILTDRAIKKEDENLKQKLKLKLDDAKFKKSRKEKLPLTLPVGERSLARTADRCTAAGDIALNRLHEKRLKHQVSESQSRLSRTKPKVPSATSPSSSSESENISSYHGEEETSPGVNEMIDSDDKKGIPGSEQASYEDVKGITIQRSKLAKWFMEPFFEDLIVGCFVRIGIGKSTSGPVYRLCMVQSVDSSDPEAQYNLEGINTHKYLICFWGNESSATKWQMAVVSDSSPSEKEYEQLVKEVKRSGGPLPCKREVLAKRETLERAHNYVYSANNVKQMLQEKKHASSRPLNIAVEKDRLKRRLEAAESKGDEAEVERIKARLQELEASRQAQEMDAKAIRLSEMNKKNRAENLKTASKLRPVNVSLKAGDAGYDPFSRRWTRSRNYYDAKAGQRNEASVGTADKYTAAALEAAADAGKLVDTRAPTDQETNSYVLHNFELPISLAALEKFGGPQGARLGCLARKQRIEATIGCRVPEDDGRKHAQTLTVSDYKRRRGLL
ncbi:hypothetical protein TIFTF001_013257 [Ficus carica]|uniref:Plus3 domain-containing protein n=1 Tax=Ficus carica TaxID=3494 RepID=A0AA88D4G1_FICCA|nr:hypothetical protein TIFTF001_013257 [Ficus carica]